MKTESILILAMVILLGGLAASVSAGTYSGGTGEPNNPYRISDANDMNEIGLHDEDWGAHFVMVNDINLADYTGTQFNIIGNDVNAFTGVFDGNGFTISNFTYTCTGYTDDIGLFGRIDDPNAKIKNLALIAPNVDANSGFSVGSLVGLLYQGTVSGCYAIGGKVSGYCVVGGLVGACGGEGPVMPPPFREVVNCGAIVNVVGNGGNVGGLTGWNSQGTISRCYAAGNVSSTTWRVGGLVGYNEMAIIESCYATGNVQGDSGVGGLVGIVYMSFFGYLSKISNCYAIGNVSADEEVGGLVGYNESGTISNCYAAGAVGGNFRTGGLVGNNGSPYYSDTISNCYATGAVDGNFSTGGLVGSNYSTISNCYAAGAVDGNDSTGGMVGDDHSGSYTKCFWDNTVNPSLQGIGNATDPNVIGESTANMQTKSTFTDASWDFVRETVNGPNDVWAIHEAVDYPKHVWKLVNFIGWYEIDFLDYAFFANYWQDTNCGGANDCDGTDLDFSDKVDANDLQIFCSYWLEGAGE